jgi:hypothetical protein
VQKARAAIKAEDYLGAKEAVKDIPAKISAELIALDSAAAKRSPRTSRRVR